MSRHLLQDIKEYDAMFTTCRVLIIEDAHTDFRMICNSLENANMTFDITGVTNLTEGLKALSQRVWDIVLCDLSLPDSRDLNAVQAIHRTTPQIPIVVLTGQADEEMALNALNEGAQDYLVKGSYSTDSLERAIRYAIQRQKNTELAGVVEQLRDRDRLLAKKNRRLRRLYHTAHQFVENVSHEFRTPLTVIKEYVSLIRDEIVGGLHDEQKRLLDIVADRADDLNTMVDDMLDISRLEAGMLGASRADCRVNEIIDQVRPSLLKKSTIKDLTLDFDVPDGLPAVFCDERKTGRVLINLAVNAMKFCGTPGEVRVWAEDRPMDNEVVIGVTDNGPGISEEKRADIFRRFKKGEGNLHGSTKGFGLGLNIARELIYLNLGEIHVISREGEGSTFAFSVPYADPVEIARRNCHRLQHDHADSVTASMIVVEPDRDCESMSSEAISGFLNITLRHNDLLIPISDNRWVVVLPLANDELPTFFKRFEETKQEFDHNRPAGAIPEFQLTTVGSWDITKQADDLLAEIESLCEAREACCV